MSRLDHAAFADAASRGGIPDKVVPLVVARAAGSAAFCAAWDGMFQMLGDPRLAKVVPVVPPGAIPSALEALSAAGFSASIAPLELFATSPPWLAIAIEWGRGAEDEDCIAPLLDSLRQLAGRPHASLRLLAFVATESTEALPGLLAKLEGEMPGLWSGAEPACLILACPSGGDVKHDPPGLASAAAAAVYASWRQFCRVGDLDFTASLGLSKEAPPTGPLPLALGAGCLGVDPAWAVDLAARRLGGCLLEQWAKHPPAEEVLDLPAVSAYLAGFLPDESIGIHPPTASAPAGRIDLRFPSGFSEAAVSIVWRDLSVERFHSRQNLQQRLLASLAQARHNHEVMQATLVPNARAAIARREADGRAATVARVARMAFPAFPRSPDGFFKVVEGRLAQIRRHGEGLQQASVDNPSGTGNIDRDIRSIQSMISAIPPVPGALARWLLVAVAFFYLAWNSFAVASGPAWPGFLLAAVPVVFGILLAVQLALARSRVEVALGRLRRAMEAAALEQVAQALQEAMARTGNAIATFARNSASDLEKTRDYLSAVYPSSPAPANGRGVIPAQVVLDALADDPASGGEVARLHDSLSGDPAVADLPDSFAEPSGWAAAISIPARDLAVGQVRALDLDGLLGRAGIEPARSKQMAVACCRDAEKPSWPGTTNLNPVVRWIGPRSGALPQSAQGEWVPGPCLHAITLTPINLATPGADTTGS
jgi:hypothetical protein